MPKIVFKLDQKFDSEIGDAFMDQKIGDYDFGQDRIISIHPNLDEWRGKPGPERTSAVSKYVDEVYVQNEAELADSLKAAAKIWGSIEGEFFSEMKVIFGDLNFYEHEIMVGKPSIFGCAVIEDDGRSFQFHYKLPLDNAEEFKRNVAHEAVHFIADAYMAKEEFDDLLGDWNFREILPVLILNKPEFLALTNAPEYGYPQHQGDFLEGHRKTWGESKDFREFLEKSRANKAGEEK